MVRFSAVRSGRSGFGGAAIALLLVAGMLAGPVRAASDQCTDTTQDSCKSASSTEPATPAATRDACAPENEIWIAGYRVCVDKDAESSDWVWTQRPRFAVAKSPPVPLPLNPCGGRNGEQAECPSPIGITYDYRGSGAGDTSGWEPKPILNNGQMFVAPKMGEVFAREAATGQLLWSYSRHVPEGLKAPPNRPHGIVVYDNKVYVPSVDAALVALDAKTGKPLWERQVEDWASGYYMTMEPLVVKDKLLVGMAGKQAGMRDFVAAFDAATGKQAWRTYMDLARVEGTQPTWQTLESRRREGSWAWMISDYDPVTNTIFWGVGSPRFSAQRSADSIYSLSTLALDGDTGTIKPLFKYQPTK